MTAVYSAATVKKPALSLCVFCGSQSGVDPAHAAAASTLGQAMARDQVALVFGGGRVGLMGRLADALLADGGHVVGVIPEFLVGKELAHAGANEMVVVPDMHTRKRVMFERSDAFCILPGGVGTLDEFFEIVTWRQLHRHNKPIIVANIGGYWSPLVALFQEMIEKGFAHRGHDELITVVDRAEDVLPVLHRELAAPKPLPAFVIEPFKG